MLAVQGLCQEVLWIDQGRIAQRGRADFVIQQYLKHSAVTVPSLSWPTRAEAPGNELVRLQSIRIRPRDGEVGDVITIRTPFLVEVGFWNLTDTAMMHIDVQLVTASGVVVIASAPVHQPDYVAKPLAAGRYQSRCAVPGDLLNAGHYFIRVAVKMNGRVIYRHGEALMCEIQDSPERSEAAFDASAGVIRPILDWRTVPIKE